MTFIREKLINFRLQNTQKNPNEKLYFFNAKILIFKGKCKIRDEI